MANSQVLLFAQSLSCVCERGSQDERAMEMFPEGSLWLVL